MSLSLQYPINDPLAHVSDTISGFCDETLCTKDMLDKIRTVNFNRYENSILNFITNQVSIDSVQPNYSLYKIGLLDGEPSHHTDIRGDISSMFYTSLQTDDKHLLLNCLDIESLFLFLSENRIKSRRYVFIPVSFGSDVHTIGHFSVLIFDTMQNMVYFADPNGKTSFFDNVFINYSKKNKTDSWASLYYAEMYIDSEVLIEKLFACYINKFNSSTGSTYKFIPRSTWNPKEYCLNKNIDSSLIGSGHCVITGTMIINYLHMTNFDIEQMLEIISKIPTDKIIELINSYSAGIYQLLI